MYMVSTKTVNALIVGSDRCWLLFIATPDGLRQFGPVHRSAAAARAAVGGR